jgi:hypothetical protein
MATYREILGESPTLDNDIEILCLSLMSKDKRNKYLDADLNLRNRWNKMMIKINSKELIR